MDLISVLLYNFFFFAPRQAFICFTLSSALCLFDTFRPESQFRSCWAAAGRRQREKDVCCLRCCVRLLVTAGGCTSVKHCVSHHFITIHTSDPPVISDTNTKSDICLCVSCQDASSAEVGKNIQSTSCGC